MEENVIAKISEAEAEAAELKAAAQAEAEKILAAAEKQSAEIVKKSEADCSSLREQSRLAAEKKAAEDYDKSIKKAQAEAKSYANGLLAFAETHVTDIVGRLTK